MEQTTNSETLRIIEYADGERIDTTKAMETLQECINSKHLEIGKAPILTVGGIKITKDYAEKICMLPQLETLTLRCEISAPALKIIAKRGSIHTLDLSYAHLHSQESLAYLQDLKSLRTLNLTSTKYLAGTCFTNLDEKSLVEAGKLKSLQSLTLEHLDISNIKLLGQLPELRELILDGLHITDKGLHHIGKLKSLRRLSLQFSCSTYLHPPQVSARGFARLSTLENLEYLNLSQRSRALGSDSLKEIGKITSLKELDLSATETNDQGLEHLKNLQQLESLNIGGCIGITDIGMQHIAALKSLHTLHMPSLTAERISGYGLLWLTTLPNLKQLFMHTRAHLGIKVEHFKALQAMDGLEDFLLDVCPH